MDEEEFEEPRIRRKTFDPVNPYEFCMAFSKITGRPIGLFLRNTKGWPVDWFFSIQSECKQIKTREGQAKYINWFVKRSKPIQTDDSD